MKRKLLVVLACILAAAVSANGALVAHYEFEGDASDSAGSHDGTMEGGAAIVSDGVRGNVLGLNGTDSIVRINDFVYTNSVTHEVTLNFWFKINANEENADMIYMYNHGPEARDNNFDAYYRNSGHAEPGYVNIRSRQADQSSRIVRSPQDEEGEPRYDDGQWHMLTSVISGDSEGLGTLTLYVDGQFADSRSDLGTLSALDPVSGSDDPWDIILGARLDRTGSSPAYTPGDPERFMDGYMDDVRLYDEALSAGDVQSLYNTTVPEPATIALLGFGSLVLARRKRTR